MTKHPIYRVLDYLHMKAIFIAIFALIALMILNAWLS